MKFEASQKNEKREPEKIREIEVNGKNIEVFEKTDGLIDLHELNKLAEENKATNGEKAKKVLLIDFKTLGKVPENENYSFQNFINLGIHRIVGYLESYQIPTTVARFSELKNNSEALAKLLQDNDIIGVSNLTGQVEQVYELCRNIKKQFGDKKLVVGGSEHYLAQDYILADQKTTGIDACCLGQGELPLLALALGQEKEKVNSLAYSEKNLDSIRVVQNKPFRRLVDGDSHGMEILNIKQASPFEKEEVMGLPPFNELNGLDGFKFDGTFVTQTGSGCQFSCDFCPSKNFFGAKYVGNSEVAQKEILEFKKSFPEMKEVFLTFADAMLNPTDSDQISHLKKITDFMAQANNESGPQISWFAYLSAPKLEIDESIEDWRIKWDKMLAEMASAGCVMAGVGVEEIIYDRNKTYHKGQNIDTASEFIDLIGKHILTRSLLILGGPNQFYLEREKSLKGEDAHKEYKSDKDLIKGEILEFMKAHPQALYRMNPWTLVYGTDDFYKYKDCLAIDINDPSQLKQLDHLHSVIDPEKMYSHIEKERGIKMPTEKRWVKDKEVWFELMEEIMEEYLMSEEYLKYVETLKDKETRGRKNLLYKIAMKFKENAISQINKNRVDRLK